MNEQPMTLAENDPVIQVYKTAIEDHSGTRILPQTTADQVFFDMEVSTTDPNANPTQIVLNKSLINVLGELQSRIFCETMVVPLNAKLPAGEVRRYNWTKRQNGILVTQCNEPSGDFYVYLEKKNDYWDICIKNMSNVTKPIQDISLNLIWMSTEPVQFEDRTTK